MKYPSANITYGGLEDSGLTVKVKDSANPKTKWQVWKKDKDTDAENEAYTAIKAMEFGQVFGVTYGEKENSFTPTSGTNAGQVISYTQRTIYSVIPPVAEAQREPSQPNPLYDKPKEEPKDDKFWDMKAYKQCLWAKWLKDSVQLDINEPDWKDIVWDAFKEIEKDANKRFFIYSEPEAHEKLEDHPQELPTIQVQEEATEFDKIYSCVICAQQGATAGDGHDCIAF